MCDVCVGRKMRTPTRRLKCSNNILLIIIIFSILYYNIFTRVSNLRKSAIGGRECIGFFIEFFNDIDIFFLLKRLYKNDLVFSFSSKSSLYYLPGLNTIGSTNTYCFCYIACWIRSMHIRRPLKSKCMSEFKCPKKNNEKTNNSYQICLLTV